MMSLLRVFEERPQTMSWNWWEDSVLPLAEEDPIIKDPSNVKLASQAPFHLFPHSTHFTEGEMKVQKRKQARPKP